MADVTEVIHKISYEVNDGALNNATKAIHAQIAELDELTRKLNIYQRQMTRLADGEVRKLDDLSRKIDDVNRKIAGSASKLEGIFKQVGNGILDGIGANGRVEDAVEKMTGNIIKQFKEIKKFDFKNIAKLATNLFSFTNIAPLAISFLIDIAAKLFNTSEAAKEADSSYADFLETLKGNRKSSLRAIDEQVGDARLAINTVNDNTLPEQNRRGAASDDFVSAYSAAQMVDKEASHPYIVEASTYCPECDGHGQVQRECDTCPTGVELVRCPGCGGSGQISRNPGQHIIIPHEQMKDGTPVQIVYPDVQINTHHREVCAQVMSLIVEALHLQKTDAAQSGVAKAIDQERLYKFISAISNAMFDKVITDTLRDIIAYRNIEGDTPYAFRIIKPTQFRIKTSADLLEEYNAGTSAGMPAFIRQRMALDFVDKQYSGDDVMKKKAQLITELDSLSVLSTAEILDLRTAGAITESQLQYSRQLPQLIDELTRDKGEHWLLNASTQNVKDLVPYAEEDVIVRVGLN